VLRRWRRLLELQEERAGMLHSACVIAKPSVRMSLLMAPRARLVAVALLLACFLGQAATAIRTKSATWDEVNYLGIGDYLLRNGRWDVPAAVLHPPLAFYLNAIPVLFADIDRGAVWRHEASGTPSLAFLGAADAERGRALLSSPANEDDRLLFASRLVTILQATLLGLFVYRLAARLYGPWGGLAAVCFFAFCPNMLANGSLITPDMTLTVCVFLAVSFLHQALTDGRPASFVWAGVTLGLALLSKFTALLLFPIEAMIVGHVVVRGARPSLKWMGVALVCAAAVFLAGYQLNPLPYWLGLQVQGSHGGHSAFLMGEISADGWWYYCLAAFGMKTPIPILILVALAAIGLGRRGLADVGRAFRLRALRRTAVVPSGLTLEDAVLWVPVIVLFAFFSVELRSIGLRYVLPAYPFVFVIAAGAMVSLGRLTLFAGRARYLLAVPLVWYAVGTLAVWPDHLAYFNESIGGPKNGYRYLVDSNLDWGQELKGLKAYIDREHIDRVYLSYFGLDDPRRYGIRYMWLPSYELPNPNPQATVNISRGSYVAISATNLQGVYMTPPTMFRWLDRYTPVARIGHSLFVYRLE
jgi:4-amino-4-deoxy-L-arabinose transferase-like glycosyltransferase